MRFRYLVRGLGEYAGFFDGSMGDYERVEEYCLADSKLIAKGLLKVMMLGIEDSQALDPI